MEYSKEYLEFIDQVKVFLLAHTVYREAQIDFKKDGEIEGIKGDRLVIETSDGDRCNLQAIRIGECFLAYQQGSDMEEVLNTIEEAVLAGGEITKKLALVRDLSDYEKVKSQLIVRLLNYDRNQEELKTAVYRKIGDIAMVIYLEIGQTGQDYSSFKVSKQIWEEWGMDDEQLWEEIFLNTYLKQPPRMFDLEGFFKLNGGKYGNFMNLLEPYHVEKGPTGNFLTTVNKINGAVAIFLPGVADRIGELMGSDFFIAFTSVHECVVHSCKTVLAASIKKTLGTISKKAPAAQDFLSAEVYYYSRSQKKFGLVFDDAGRA